MRNLLLVSIALLLSGCAVQKVDLLAAVPPIQQIRVWIDTDMACGQMLTSSDPDDCLAYLLAKRAGINIVGVSTVAGNGNEMSIWNVAQNVVGQDTPLFRGNEHYESEVLTSLAQKIKERDLVILALGPLTNIARLLLCHPSVREHIKYIVFVGGRSVGERFIPNPKWPITVELSDLNVEKDLDAVDMVIGSGVPLVYVPYKAGSMVPLSFSTLGATGVKLPQELAERLRDWSATFSVFLGTNGFLPFDVIAVAYALWPGKFDCVPVRANRVDSHLYLSTPPNNESREVRCLPRDPDKLRNNILAILAGS